MAKLTQKITYSDGRDETVSCITADFVRYEHRARREGWGKISDSPITGSVFLAWSALYRQDLCTADFETWLESVENVESVSDTPTAEKDATDPF